MNKKLILICVFANISLIFSMGGPKEPYGTSNFKPESELGKDQQVYWVEVLYKDGTKAVFEGLNINGKTQISGASLRKGKNNIPSSINFKKIQKIEFNGIEGTSLLMKTTFKKGSSMDYLISDKLCFGAWIEGSDRASISTLEAQHIDSINFKETPNNKVAAQNNIIKEVHKADLQLTNSIDPNLTDRNLLNADDLLESND